MTRQSSFALMTTPWKAWSCATYPLPSYSILLLIRYVTLWPWPLTLNICMMSVQWSTSAPNLSATEQSTAELLRFECLTNDLEHVTHIALGSGIIFTKFELGQPICSWFQQRLSPQEWWSKSPFLFFLPSLLSCLLSFSLPAFLDPVLGAVLH